MQYVTRTSDLTAGADSVALPVRSIKHIVTTAGNVITLHIVICVNETDQMKTSDVEPL